jgi:hypothetical protein
MSTDASKVERMKVIFVRHTVKVTGKEAHGLKPGTWVVDDVGKMASELWDVLYEPDEPDDGPGEAA